jgi:hypothetical protein
MQDQRTRPTSAEPRVTHFDELEACTTMRRVQLAVEDGDNADVAAAAAAWRQAARLAGRLQRQARQIADDLEHATS